MKFALLLAFTVAVAALAQDQVVPAKVAWGDEAPDDGLKSSGARKPNSADTVMCLIAPNVVLTAAHCLDGVVPSVVVGTHYLTGFRDGELANVTEKIKHPNGTDVGILILDHNISITQPVAVSFEFVPADVLTW
ncbi:hypothetical protein AaE_002716, partial [Aphanomyces astaci]